MVDRLLRKLRNLACVVLHGDHEPYWFSGGTPDCAVASCRHCGHLFVIRFDRPHTYIGTAQRRRVS